MSVRACYEWLSTVLRDGQKVGPHASQRNILLEWSAVSPGQLLLDCIYAMFTRNCSWRPSRFPAIFDPGTGGMQTGLERIALLRDGIDLGAEQGVGALQFLMAHEQALHPFGDLVEVGLGQHRHHIVGLGDSLGGQGVR